MTSSPRLPARATPALLVLLVLGALLVTVVASRAQQGPDFASVRGDVTLDTAVSVIDALAVLRTAVGTSVPDSFRVTPNGDTNCDLGITALDALIILSDVVGLDLGAFCIGDPLVASLDLTPDSSRLVRGDSLQLGATTLDDGGAPLTRDVAYSSLDPAVATVDADGLVVTLTSGTARMVAVSEEVHDTTELTVLNPPVAIIVTPTVDTMNTLGETQALSASVRDSTGAELQGLAVVWGSSDPAVATVDSVGVVQSVAAGLASITATFRGVTSNAVGISVEPLAIAYCGGAGATVHDEDIVVDQTWTEAASPHRVTQDFTVQSGATLTIEAGSIVCIDLARAITFDGGVLDARGTPTDSIFFVPSAEGSNWEALYFQGFPTDTSRIRHAILQQGGRFSPAVQSLEGHALEVDSSLVTEALTQGVQLEASGSRLTASTVTGVGTGDAVRAGGRVLLEDLLLEDSPGDGVEILSDSVVMRNVEILRPAAHGVIQGGSGAGTVLSGVRVEDPGSRGLYLNGVPDTLIGIRVVGSGSYVYQGPADNLAQLLVDDAAQDSLVDGTADTLLVVGGVLGGPDTVAVRPDLPWRLDNGVEVRGGTVLSVRPGATVAMNFAEDLTFDDGGRLSALGTAAEPVTFVGVEGPFCQLRFQSGPPDGGGTFPADTSRILHGIVSRGGRFCWTLESREGHVLLVDSTTVRQSESDGVRLSAPGSRFVDSSVDTIANGSGDGMELSGAVTVQGSTVRSAGTGIHLLGTGATVRDFVVEDASTHGLDATAGSGHVVVDGRIENSGSEGLRATVAMDSLARVVVTGSASWGTRLTVDNLAKLAPTPADQDDLAGNARADSILVEGGALRRDTLEVRPDFPWLVNFDVNVLDSALLVVQPGGSVTFNGARGLIFDGGGRLSARGTPTDSVRFAWREPGTYWDELVFRSPDPDNFGNPFPDTSWITNAVLEGGGRSGLAVVSAQEVHAVVLDSVAFRSTGGQAVRFGSPGSSISRSVVEGTQTGDGLAVVGPGPATVDSVTVSQAAARGVHVASNSVTLRDVTVLDAGGMGVRLDNGSAHRIEGLRVEGSGGEGLQIDIGVGVDTIGGLFVTGAGSWGIRMEAQNLEYFLTDRTAFDSIRGNLNDSLLVDGGTFRGDTLWSLVDYPLVLNADLNVLDSAVLLVEPGASLIINQAREIRFDDGGRLHARGAPTDSVRIFERGADDFWDGLRFASPDPPQIGPQQVDTSYLSFAALERGGRGGLPLLHAQEAHVLLVDSTRMDNNSTGPYLDLESPGSRVRNSYLGFSQGGQGVRLEGSGTAVEETLLEDVGSDGVYLLGDNALIRDVTVRRAGGIGIFLDGGSGSRIEGARVEDVSGQGVRLDEVLDTITGLRVTGAGSWVYNGPLDNLEFFDTREKLDSLLGNARDTLWVQGGTFRGDTLWVRPELPMILNSTANVLDSAVMKIEAGGGLLFNGSWDLAFDDGGRLHARGTEAEKVVITQRQPGDYWDQISFGTRDSIDFEPQPVDTSWITNAVVSRGAQSTPGLVTLSGSTDRHVLLVDSTEIFQFDNQPIQLLTVGSAIRRSRLADNLNGYGVTLGDSTEIRASAVRGMEDDGIRITGLGVVLDSVEVSGNGGVGINVLSADADAVTITMCNIEGNVGVGLFNATGGTLTAEDNWWGDAGGPEVGNGDGVDADVDFEPFLGAPVTIPFIPGG